MSRFTVRPVHFGRRPGPDEDTEGLPTPARVKLAARRAAGIAEASAVLEYLPGPGESPSRGLHRPHGPDGRYRRPARQAGTLRPHDDSDAGIQRPQPQDDAGVAGHRRRRHSLPCGEPVLSLPQSKRFGKPTLEEFRSRKQRAACCHSHAKVVTLAFATGERLCIEGIANLCGNGSGREQFALINDAGLHNFHAAWIAALLDKHEGRAR